MTQNTKKSDEYLSHSNSTLMIGIDKNGSVIHFNGACERVTGYARDEVLNKKIWEIMAAKEHVAQLKRIFTTDLQDGRTYEFAAPWIDVNGNEILISWNTLPIKNETGGVGEVCFIGHSFSLDNGDTSSLKASGIELETGKKSSRLAHHEHSASIAAKRSSKYSNSC